MDSGRGDFVKIEKTIADQIHSASGGRDNVPIFETGETIEIRGSKFKIRSLDSFTGIVTLKLLPRAEGESLKKRSPF